MSKFNYKFEIDPMLDTNPIQRFKWRITNSVI